MTIKQLTYLFSVVQENINISRAARRLGVSEPNISKQLSLLEKEIQAPLFEKAGRRLCSLTPAGRQLYRHARKIITELASLREDISQTAITKTAVIGTTAAMAKYVLPGMLAAAMYRLGDISVEVEPLAGDMICEAVMQGRCDLGLIGGSVKPDPKLLLLPWYRWRYRLIMPQHKVVEHGLKDNLRLLREYPIIVNASVASAQSSVFQAMSELGMAEQIDRITPNPDEVKNSVRANGHIGLIAEMAYSEEVDRDLIAYEMPAPFPTLMAWIAVRRGASLLPGVTSLIYGIASHIRPNILESLMQGTIAWDHSENTRHIKIPRYG